MHEMSIATNILNLAEKSLAGHQQLLSITVQIGELAGIEIESLRFCFDAIKRSSPFADTQLIIEKIPGQAVCGDCGKS
ncbi:MAG: hydrogenase maturation nickel metallochaperone HypA, partial [Calditrichota bacterium]